MAELSEEPIIVIGRGNSGTRVVSHTLIASRVYMGDRINPSGDKVPGRKMYEACRIIAKQVEWNGDLSWNFDRLHEIPISPQFEELIGEYVEDVLAEDTPRKGWKLPETTLAYPWIARMFPRAKYVYVLRDPRDCLLSRHLTDDLRWFDLPVPDTDDKLDDRVASWKYQYELVKSTPRPSSFISIRYEDLVREQEAMLGELEGFLAMPLARVVLDPSRIGRWKEHPEILEHIGPLSEAMRECGYE